MNYSYSYGSSYDATAATAAASILMVYCIVLLVISILVLVSQWKLFSKAGEPGWASIVPIYNLYVLFKIAFGSGWLFLLTLVPFVNIVIVIMLYFKLAKAFGKGIGFGFGLLFLSPIFFPILAFGSSRYIGA